MNREIKVWDPLVRVFHWSLVLVFIVAYLSGEEESDVHIYAGYIVMGLITFRLVWGFIGTRNARFSNFVTTPVTAISYLKNLTVSPKRYLGHNPAGGLMVMVMLITLFVVTVSGLKVYALEQGLGPLAADAPQISLISAAHADDDSDERYENHGHDEDDEEDFWEEIHEVTSNFMVLLILMHIAGVIIMGRVHDENLVKAMLTGKKKIKDE